MAKRNNGQKMVVLQNCCFIAKIALFYRIMLDNINKFGTLPTNSIILGRVYTTDFLGHIDRNDTFFGKSKTFGCRKSAYSAHLFAQTPQFNKCKHALKHYREFGKFYLFFLTGKVDFADINDTSELFTFSSAMSYGLYISSEGAMSQEYRMQTISNNIANLETPGFKREVALQMARHTASVAIGEVPFDTGLMTDIGGGVHTIGTHTEFRQGPIMATEMNSDLAINGDAWFLVRDVANGEEFLTRAGNFQVDRNGVFVSEWGRSRFQLLDIEGEPVTLPVAESTTWHITDDGVLHEVGVGRVQQIALVQPDDLKTMVKIGENVYRLDVPDDTLGYQPIVDEERPQIRAGHLEMSAVNPSTEMIEMIVASRAVETNVKMMHAQDEATGSLINRVLRVG